MAKIDPKHLKKYTVKWILSNEPLDFFMRIAKSFEHHMDRRMPGRVNFEIMSAQEYAVKYNDGVEIDHDDVLRLLKENEIQLADFPAPLFAQKIKERYQNRQTRGKDLDFVESDWSSIEMPFLFRNETHATAFMQSHMGEQLLYYRNQLKVKPMAMVSWGGSKLIAGDKPYTSPEDFEGSKVSLQYHTAVSEKIFESLGAEVTDSDADAYETDMPSFDMSKKVVTELNHSINTNIILASHEFWRNVIKCECDYREHTKEEEDGCLRKQLKRACNEATRDRDVWNDEMTAKFRQECESRGIELHQVSDSTPFKEKTASVYDQFVKFFYDEQFIDSESEVVKHDLRTRVNDLSDNSRSAWCDDLTIDQ